MNYVNIHGQPVTVDFRAMVRAIHPNACCSPAALSAAARSTTRRVYETDDFSNTALGHGETEDAAWEAAWKTVEADAEAMAQRDDEHDPDEVY